MVATLYRTYELPWTLGAAEERRFRKILLNVLVVLAVLALIMPWLPTPEVERSVDQEIPERYARLVLEKKAPPPPPPVQLPEPEPEPEPEVKAEEPKPEPKPEPEVSEPEPEPKVVKEDVRKKAAARLAFMEDLADLRENQAVAAVTQSQNLAAGVGDGPRSERSLITSKVGQSSGGINTAALSRDTGGGELGGREVTRVASAIQTAAPKREARRSGDSNKASRSREEIELVFDRYKGQIYALYNRALRKNPALQGKLVLRLTIEPSGEVSLCEVISSELGDPDLERKLVMKVKMFQFEAKDVESVTTTKPIDFFPA